MSLRERNRRLAQRAEDAAGYALNPESCPICGAPIPYERIAHGYRTCYGPSCRMELSRRTRARNSFSPPVS